MMTNNEIRKTLRQMMNDWNNLTDAQKEAALKAAAVKAGR